MLPDHRGTIYICTFALELYDETKDYTKIEVKIIDQDIWSVLCGRNMNSRLQMYLNRIMYIFRIYMQVILSF